ncbi:MAG: hypothetical protein ACREFM_07655, partial [Hypericibacter sp.]
MDRRSGRPLFVFRAQTQRHERSTCGGLESELPPDRGTTMGTSRFTLIAGGALLAMPVAALAADGAIDLGDTEIYTKSLAALTVLFVVAVLLENAFSVLFNWRVFLAYFDRRGVKTIIMVIVSLIIVNAFSLDVMASLLSAYMKDPVSSGPVSKFVTALILAGGSAGVYNIMYALGYRSERRDELPAKPPADKAWVAVRVKRVTAKGPVYVKLRDLGAVDATSPVPIAGTITFQHQALTELLLRNVNRFPQNGGYVVEPGKVYAISVEGTDKA